MVVMKDLTLFINGSMSCKFDYNIHISLTKVIRILLDQNVNQETCYVLKYEKIKDKY